MSCKRKFIFTERESKALNKEANHLTCTQSLNFFTPSFQVTHAQNYLLDFHNKFIDFFFSIFMSQVIPRATGIDHSSGCKEIVFYFGL